MIDIEKIKSDFHAGRAVTAKNVRALIEEIENLRGAMQADNERLARAGERVGINLGCDTVDTMADTIVWLRTELAALKDSNRWRMMSDKEYPNIDDVVLAVGLNLYDDEKFAYYAAKYLGGLEGFSIPGIGGLTIIKWRPLPKFIYSMVG